MHEYRDRLTGEQPGHHVATHTAEADESEFHA
jgi:hypothetical protein